MTIAASAKAPWHLWLVAIIAVLFNAIGVFAAVVQRLLAADDRPARASLTTGRAFPDMAAGGLRNRG